MRVSPFGFTRFFKPAALACVALAGVSFFCETSHSSPRAQASQKAGKDSISRLLDFRDQIKTGPLIIPQNAKQLGRSSRTIRASLGDGNNLVYVRAPFRGARHAVRRHRVAFMLAQEAGYPAMVPRAGLFRLQYDLNILTRRRTTSLTKGTRMMVVEDAGPEFEALEKLAQPGSRRVEALSEELRVAGATISTLVRQLDGNSGSALLSPDGQLKLIDLDVTLGTPHTTSSVGSVFFPAEFSPHNHKGSALAYRSRQSGLGDLPPGLATMVGRLAEKGSQEVAAEFHIERLEARVVRDMARQIRDRGLSGAISLFDRDFAASIVPKAVQKQTSRAARKGTPADLLDQ